MKPFFVHSDGTPMPETFDKKGPEADLEQPSMTDLCKTAFDEAERASTKNFYQSKD